MSVQRLLLYSVFATTAVFSTLTSMRRVMIWSTALCAEAKAALTCPTIGEPTGVIGYGYI